MAWIVRRSESTNKYDTSSVSSYDNVSAADSNTISSSGSVYEYCVGVPRRCSRCWMYDWGSLGCKKKKDFGACKKSYKINNKKKTWKRKERVTVFH